MHRFYPDRRSLSVAAGCLLAASLSDCASVDDKGAASRDVPARDFATIVLIAAPYNVGRVGAAYLLPNGDRTIVKIEASGVPSTVARPIHLYTFIFEGSCVVHAQKPAFALTETVLATSVANPGGIGSFGGPLTLANAAPVSYAALRAKPYAIVVKSAPSDGDQDLFCGDIGGR